MDPKYSLGRTDTGQVWIIARKTQRSRAWETKKAPYGPFHFVRVILPVALQNDPPIAIQDVKARPHIIVPCVPGPEFVVLAYRVRNTGLSNVSLYIPAIVLEGELRRVDADDLKAESTVLGLPAFQVRNGAAAIDAGVSPKVDQHDLTAQVGEGDRHRGVYPAVDTREAMLGSRRSREAGRQGERPGGRCARDK